MVEHSYGCQQCGGSKSPSHDTLCSECFAKSLHERLKEAVSERDALREVMKEAENVSRRLGPSHPNQFAPLSFVLAKVPRQTDEPKPKHWGEHFREAVAALTAADAELEKITGWSGGSGSWSAQETHPRVQAALVLLKGKYGEDPRVDAFLAELAKDPK